MKVIVTCTRCGYKAETDDLDPEPQTTPLAAAFRVLSERMGEHSHPPPNDDLFFQWRLGWSQVNEKGG